MNIQENQIIGELVAQDYRTASVFKKYGIDFCCQGTRTINDACKKKNIDEQSVVSDLNALMQSKSDNTIDYQNWEIDLLADYIEKKHHRYVEEKSQEIIPYLDKICRVHGDRHQELFEINNQFNACVGELTTHMKKEELMLFPFIRKMVKIKKGNLPIEAPSFGTVQNPINMMLQEHNIEGDRFKKIEILSNQFTPPQDACNTYRVTFALLKEFEQDLHLHIHLENNILFPKAIKLENELSVLK
jgi:regulator of cell morphogenesis and NO signaling